jgi:hypothetical protein
MLTYEEIAFKDSTRVFGAGYTINLTTELLLMWMRRSDYLNVPS